MKKQKKYSTKSNKDRQKLLLKVIDKGEWRWVHLCHIDRKMYQKFKNLYPAESFVLSTFITLWVKQDFQVNLSMVYRKNILQLKNLILTWYRHEYPELYLKNCPGDERRISHLTSIWLTQHMEYEIETHGKEDEDE